MINSINRYISNQLYSYVILNNRIQYHNVGMSQWQIPKILTAISPGDTILRQEKQEKIFANLEATAPLPAPSLTQVNY